MFYDVLYLFSLYMAQVSPDNLHHENVFYMPSNCSFSTIFEYTKKTKKTFFRFHGSSKSSSTKYLAKFYRILPDVYILPDIADTHAVSRSGTSLVWSHIIFLVYLVFDEICFHYNVLVIMTMLWKISISYL
jgi:hypothetical protein